MDNSVETKQRPDKSLMKPQAEHAEESLKGTFVSVMILGGIIAVSWVAIFILFLQRGG